MNKFKEFQKQFTSYQKLFGLDGYKTYFKSEPLAESFAEILVNQDGMVATIAFNNKLGAKDEPFQNVHNTAKHEAIHLLVGRLSDYAQSRYMTKSNISEAEEELVRKLEKLIPDIKVGNR